MSERYSRLYTLPGNQYAEGSPVLVLAGALLKDNITGQILAQLKFKSISSKQIKAIKVTLFPQDAAGRPLDGQIEHQYLDLRAGRNVEFGQKQAIPMSDLSTRAYSVTVSEVVFSDNNIYNGSGKIFSPLPNPQPLSNHLGSAELLKQYRIACGDSSEYVPTQIEDLWYCTCGHINHIEELTCKSCLRSFNALISALDKTALTAAVKQRLSEEAARAEQERIAAEQRLQQQKAEAERKKKKAIRATIILIILAAVAALAVLAFKFWLQPSAQYNDALSMMENGQYWLAEGKLQTLNGFGKSEQALGVLDGIDTLEATSLPQHLNDGIKEILAAGTSVTVNFETQGGSVELNPITYQTDADFFGLPEAEQEGLRFVEWKLQSFSYHKKQPLSITVQAEWSDEYLIEYELYGGSAENPTTYRNDGSSVKLNAPTRSGYTFTGWTSSNQTVPTVDVVIPAGTYGNLTFTAHWKGNNYVITLDPAGGTEVPATLNAVYNDFVTLPTTVRAGYSFVGWYTSVGAYTSGAQECTSGIWTIRSDATLTARWEPVEYGITYNLDGGKNNTQNPTFYTVESGTITLQAPTRSGYKFLGWYSDSGHTTKVTTLSGSAMKDVSLYAKWEVATYTLAYTLNGGTLTGTATKTFTINDLPISLPGVTKTGCTFLGWYNGSTKCTNWNSPGDVTLTAKWDPIKYKITYNLNGGTNSSKNPSSYHVESGTITLQAPTRTGYKFLGWYSDSGHTTKVTTLSGSAMKDVSLYAKWEIITYTITYNLNGGSLSSTAKKSFTVNDLPITLPGASKSSLAFVGWNYGSASGKTVEKLNACENVTLYASFMDPNLKLTLSNDGKFYIVSSYSGTASHLDIPAYYKGIPVKQIGGTSWSLYGNISSSVTSVTLPNTITTIGSFFKGSEITSVVIPDSVTYIGENAFSQCDYLTSITFGKSVKEIGGAAFSWCSALQHITLPNSLTELGAQAFSGCNNLKSVTLSKNITEIHHNTFADCTNLTSITLHEGITTIGWQAFENCRSLQKLIIPSSVKSIDGAAFSGCNKLTFYCRANIIPDGWSSSWNNSRPVTWGYTGN